MLAIRDIACGYGDICMRMRIGPPGRETEVVTLDQRVGRLSI